MSDVHQFEAFMRLHQDMVFGTAVRYLGNEAEAEDVAQEVFLRAFDRFAELRTSPTAGGWLRTVTRNLCLNHLTRYRSRWKTFTDLEAPESDSPLNAVPSEDSVMASVGVTERRQLLESALKQLPDAQRVPLVLYHFEDLSYEEIAQRLKISLAKVKTNIHRARESLKRVLQRDAISSALLTPLS